MNRDGDCPIRKLVDPLSLLIRLRRDIGEYLRTEVAGAAVLLIATVVALAVANSPFQEAYERFWRTDAGIFLGSAKLSESLLFWINDAFMALFFFVVGLEIKREILVGELSEPRKAILPILAAVGGMIAPALIFVLLNEGGPASRGWGVPMATDIAFVIGMMALLGNRVPPGLKVFLVALAIADDIGAILVIAFFYTTHVSMTWLGAGIVAFILLIPLNRTGVDNPWPYFIIGGMIWFCVLMSGIHSTIAGVVTAAMIPAAAKIDPLAFTRRARDRLRFIEEVDVPGAHVLTDDTQQVAALEIRRAALSSVSPLQRLLFSLHPVTTFAVLPLFALGNAGVRLVGEQGGALLSQPVTAGIILGLVAGKPLGIFVMTWLTLRLKLADLPEGTGWMHILGAGMLGGIGFTMSLFLASIAFRGDPENTGAKEAILFASVVSGVLGYLVLRFGTGRTTRGASAP